MAWQVFTSTMTDKHGSGNFNQLTRTGKSFLLNSVFLWCLVNGKRVKTAVPTGIAAASVQIERTSVRATTIHQLFEFDNEFKTKIDFTRQVQSVVEVLNLHVMLLYEERSQFTHTYKSTIPGSIVDESGGWPLCTTANCSFQLPTHANQSHHCLHHRMRA